MTCRTRPSCRRLFLHEASYQDSRHKAHATKAAGRITGAMRHRRGDYGGAGSVTLLPDGRMHQDGTCIVPDSAQQTNNSKKTPHTNHKKACLASEVSHCRSTDTSQ